MGNAAPSVRGSLWETSPRRWQLRGSLSTECDRAHGGMRARRPARPGAKRSASSCGSSTGTGAPSRPTAAWYTHSPPRSSRRGYRRSAWSGSRPTVSSSSVRPPATPGGPRLPSLPETLGHRRLLPPGPRARRRRGADLLGPPPRQPAAAARPRGGRPMAPEGRQERVAEGGQGGRALVNPSDDQVFDRLEHAEAAFERPEERVVASDDRVRLARAFASRFHRSAHRANAEAIRLPAPDRRTGLAAPRGFEPVSPP